jgi:predicted phage-related endonuclease
MAILGDSLARISMHLLHPEKNLILASSEEEKVKENVLLQCKIWIGHGVTKTDQICQAQMISVRIY